MGRFAVATQLDLGVQHLVSPWLVRNDLISVSAWCRWKLKLYSSYVESTFALSKLIQCCALHQLRIRHEIWKNCISKGPCSMSSQDYRPIKRLLAVDLSLVFGTIVLKLSSWMKWKGILFKAQSPDWLFFSFLFFMMGVAESHKHSPNKSGAISNTGCGEQANPHLPLHHLAGVGLFDCKFECNRLRRWVRRILW